MATKRDVDLVIRARNEASKAIDQITQALQEFAGAQTEITQGAGKTKSTLSELGNSLRQLQQSLGGSTSKKVAQDIEAARQAVASLGRQLERAAGEAIGFRREAGQTATAIAKWRDEAARAAAAMEHQAAALEESKAAQAALNAEITRAEKDRTKLVQKDAELTAQIEKQNTALAEARSRFSALQQQLTSTANPTKKLQGDFDAAGRAVDRAVIKLDELQTTQGAVRNAIDQTGRVLERSNQKLEQQAQVQERVGAAVDRLKQRQGELNSLITTSAESQGQLEKAARESAAALERQDGAFQEATTELRQLEGAVEGAEAAFAGLSGEARRSALQAFGAQRKAVQGARQEWAQAEQRVKALSAEMRGVAQPTAAMSAAFDKARAAAGAAKTNFEAQREVLLRLREVLRESGGGALGLAQRFDRLRGSLAQAEGTLNAHTAATKRAEAADRQLATEAQRAAAATQRLSGATAGVGGAMSRGAAATTSFSAALRQFYGNSRTALSFTQRLRSEVLALASAYLGFFAAFRGVTSVVDAFRTLEAAQNRLGAVFQQDEGLVAREINFLRREADRLGISFQVLSDQYSKFAVAADTANFSNEAIRKTFLSVAEAGRVNKLSIEQLNGIFLALQQIISKGKVQSEELRRQLGDRLPGAFQIMASALNVTTAELDRMLKAGEVVADQDTLLAFAGELDKRFGSQLPQSLKATTTEIGRFQNQLFEAALTVAQGGFIDSFTQLLRDMTETLKSADFRAFLDNLSAGLAGLTDVVGALVKNFRAVVVVVAAFIATKLAPFVVALAGSMGLLNNTAVSTRRVLFATAASMRAAGTAAGAAAAAVRGLTLALRTLLSSTGLGLLVTGIGIAIGAWATRADEATEAIVAHEKAVNDLKAAYDRVGESTKAWAEEVKNISITQAEDRLQKFREALDKVFGQLRGQLLSGAGGGLLGRQSIQPLEELIAQARAGEISIERFKLKFEELALAGGNIEAGLLADLLDLIDTMGPLNDRVEEASALLKARLARSADEAAEAMRGLGETPPVTDESQGDLEKYTEAMDTLRGAARETSDELERLEEAAKLEDALANALKFAETAEQAAAAVQAWSAGMDELATKNLDSVLQGEGRAGSFAERTLQLEGVGQGGGTSTAQDVGVLGGFIEKTWLDLFRKHFPDEAANLTERQILDLRRERSLVLQMIELLARENAEVLRTFGEDVNDISLRLAHLLGPSGAIQVLRAPPDQVLADFLPERFIDANQGLLGGGRTAGELLEITREQLGITKQEFEVKERLRDLEKDRAEEAEKQREATQKRLEDLGFSIEQQRLLNAEKDREAAIEEAVRSAKQENENVTEGQLAQIREQVGLLFDLQNATKALEEQKKRAAEADAEVNNLLATRTSLTERLQLLEEQGAPNQQIIATRDGIQQINDQLLVAIERAVGLFEALGSTEAQAAIARLQTLKLTLEDTGQKALIDFKKVGDLLASGLTNAFDQFAEAVAQGKNAVTALAQAFRQFASDFLRQIAQMILKQAIFNALKAIPGNPFSIDVGHSGGLVGSLNRRRSVNPAVFLGAMRYHSGGIAGLGPNEVPVIAEKGEELVTADDPRHRKNLDLGGGKTASPNVKVINAFDASSFLEEAMQNGRGESVILNFLKANPSAVRAAIGV